MQRGEIWWANLPQPWGRRPVLLLAREEAYTRLTWVLAAPLTSTLRDIPTSVPLDPRADGVLQPSVVTLDLIQAVRVKDLESRITRLRREKMEAVEQAIHFALGMTS